jgi:hypothetical protein
MLFLLAEVKERTPIHIIRVVDPEMVHTYPPFCHECSLTSR